MKVDRGHCFAIGPIQGAIRIKYLLNFWAVFSAIAWNFTAKF